MAFDPARALKVALLAMAMVVAARCQVHAENLSPHLKDGEAVLAPAGIVRMCANSMENLKKSPLCTPTPADSRPLKVDYPLVELINRTINRTKNYVVDPQNDDWQNPEALRGFDCEEYALLKQQVLLLRDFKKSSLRLVLVMDDKQRYSIALNYFTPEADYILDYQNNDVLDWRQTGYYFVARQSDNDPQKWHDLGWVKGGDLSRAKDVLVRPLGQNSESCVTTDLSPPRHVVEEVNFTPPPTFGPRRPKPEDYEVAAKAFKKKWQGFKAVSKIKEQAVKTWGKNVYRFYSFGQRGPDEIPAIIDMRDKRKSTKGNKKVKSWVREWQLETCRNQKLVKCPVFSTPSVGTVFKTGRDTYYTCRHNAAAWTTWAAELNGISQKKVVPPIKITSENYGRLTRFVYDSALQRKQKFSVKLFNDDPNLKFDSIDNDSLSSTVVSVVRRATDVLMFGLSGSGGERERVEQAAFSELKPGEGLFLLGYPGPSKLFGAGEGDSDGRRMYASHGTMLYELDVLGSQGRLAAFSTFGFAGNSGGPLVREDGKLVGLVCFGKIIDHDPDKSFSVAITSNPAEIEEWWNTLPPAPVPSFKLPEEVK